MSLNGRGSGRPFALPSHYLPSLRPRIARRGLLTLPLGPDEAGVLETAQDRVDGARGISGHVHDLEAEAVAARDRLQHQGCGQRHPHTM